MFRTEKIAEGVRLHGLSTRKFKTITSKIYVQTPLGDDTGLTALLPMVVSRGSARLPTMQAIASHLADLYGARFGSDVAKIGERHCLEFYYEVADSAYVGKDAELLDGGMATFGELICRPRIEGNGFFPQYVEQEQHNLVNRISSLIDNKRGYAVQQFYQVMFADEPFSTYKYGTIEEVKQATPETLLGHYRKIMAQNPIDIFVVGDVDLMELKEAWHKELAGLRNGYHPLPLVRDYPTLDEVKQVQEQGDLQQGILLMGYRTPTLYSSPDYYKLLVYSGVLGAFPHSKLFVNVREKASLAYYVWAQLEATKGFLMINAGIHPDNYAQAVEIILDQIHEINRGNVLSDELEATKRGLVNNVLTMEDNAIAMIDRAMIGAVNGVFRDTQETIKAIRQVSKEDLIEQGRKLQLDTIYFLKGHPEDAPMGIDTAKEGENQ